MINKNVGLCIILALSLVTGSVQKYIDFDDDIIISEEEDTITRESDQVLRSFRKVSDEVIIQADDKKMGDVGRFFIPEVGIDVAAYSMEDKDYATMQYITDCEDSMAMYLSWEGCMEVFADHWNQGFTKIKNCNIGTKAYLKKNDGTVVTYECVGITTGHNDGWNLTTDEGHNIIDYGFDACAYTCNGCWQNIYIVFFNRV